MNKKIILLAATVLLANGTGQAGHVVLESPLVDFIDGKPYALNGKVYGLILQVRKETKEMLFGKKNKNGFIVGLYTFEGRPETIASLAAIEDEIYASGDPERIEALRNLLSEIKEEFLEVTKSYVQNIKPFKNQIFGLLQESCNAHNNPNSFLLRWGEELDGDEGHLLRTELTTFKGFEQFCLDLATYLEDMAYSCPKARALFIKLVRESRES